MKKIFFITSLLLVITGYASPFPCKVESVKNFKFGSVTKVRAIVGRDTTIVLTVKSQSGIPSLVNGAIAYDDGYYNKWPSFEYFPDGSTLTASPEGGSHTEMGPIILHRSVNGGLSYTHNQLTVGGVAKTGIVAAILRTFTGRVIMLYQDDITYTTIKSCYNDNNGVGDWTASSTISFASDYTTSLNSYGFIQLASGKILFPIYSFKDGTSWTVQILQSTNDGASWSVRNTVADYTGAGFGEEKLTETTMVIVPDGTESSDATTKILMFCRNENNGLFVYFKSSDGGATWASDFTTEDPGGWSKHYLYLFSDLSDGFRPPAMAVFNGRVYFVVGSRQSSPTANMRLRYTSATLADAFANNHFNWSTITEGFVSNAQTLGSPEDWGYFCLRVAQGAIWYQHYDVSTQAKDPLLTTDRTWIKQGKLF